MPVKKIKNYRWIIVTLLFFATTINYLDRQIIGLLKPILEKEFSWMETGFAHIVMAFTASYSISLISIGWIIDKIGTKLGYAVSIILAQFTTSAWMAVALISIAVGVHQAWAANIFTSASDTFPKEAVSSVVGIGGMAGALGGILFPILIGNLLDNYKKAAISPQVITYCLPFVVLHTW